MARAPRVFTWSDGFHRYFVATTSRAKALEAWGFDRDLFREGAATEIEEGPGFDAAMAKPGEVIEESAGDIRRLVEAEASPAKAGPSRAAAAARKRLASAEAKLAALEDDWAKTEAGLAERERALAEERTAAEASHGKAEARLGEQLTAARAAVKAAR
jgi:hypothetical protein